MGLIGGSIALALKRSSPNIVIYGFDTPAVLQRARHAGAIDVAASTLEDACRSASVAIIATPLEKSLRVLSQVARFIPPGGIITDVGSVKVPIVKEASRLLPEERFFIGGHPMAGSERRGFENADPLLFQNAVYVLTPMPGTPRAALKRLLNLTEQLRARVMIMSAEEHDRIAALVSHLPQLAAVGLVNMVSGAMRNMALARQLAAGGFRDMTRIASSPFELWGEILSQNQSEVRRALRIYRSILKAMEQATGGDSARRKKLARFFHRAERTRQHIPLDMKGFLHPLSDIFLAVDDQPGAINRFTGVLAQKKINISDILLLRVREGEQGTFKLSFATERDAERAAEALKAAGYAVWRNR